MRFQLCALVLLGCLLGNTLADKSSQGKARRSSYFNEPALAKFRSSDAQHLADEASLDDAADNEKLGAINGGVAGAASSASLTGNKDASSGRLFLKKFLLFKNMFSSSSQPVIPIIITGAGTGTATGTTSPTSTITSTGTIPSATGTITTTPTGSARVQQYGINNEGQDDEEEAALQGGSEAAAQLVDEQALQAALASGAQEYEVVTEELQGTANTESKATQPSRINLRRKGGNRRGQVISVRIPPRYRRYFKNGQKVMLNTNNRPNKRRVVRKRGQKIRRRGGNKNRRNRNKNRRTRV